jgi:NADH-quinone oxidoreductase subunit M
MELLMEGCVEVYPIVGLSLVLSSAINGISILRAWFRIFTGVRFEAAVSLRSQPVERFSVLVLSLLILGGGFWPQPGVSSRFHAAEELMRLRRERLREAPKPTPPETQHLPLKK